MAGNDKPVIFLSSSMSELVEEREIVKKVVKKLGDGTFETYLFEEDAVPTDETPQEQWRTQLERAQVTVALLYQKFGEYTAEEIRLSRELEIPVLLFRKKDETNSLEAAAPDFVDWLQDAETGVVTKWFETPKELKKALSEALLKEIKSSLGLMQGLRRSPALSWTDGTSVQEDRTATDVARRSEPPRQLPTQSLFVGRRRETAELLDAIDAAQELGGEQLILLVGEPGVGKEAILRHLTHCGELPEFPDGTAIAPSWRDREDLEDLLQALWEEFYDAVRPVDPRQRDRQLGQIEALIFVPDLDMDITTVLETMPRSVFCATSSDAAATGFAEVIVVEPLVDDDDICAIFENRYGNEFPDASTRATFAELCRRQGANPGKIEYLATYAKLEARPRSNGEGPHPLVDWVAERAADEGLRPSSAWIAAAASEVGDGVHVPTPVLGLVAPDEIVEWGEAGELVPAEEPERVTPEHEERFRRAARDYLLDGSLSISERHNLSDLAAALGLRVEAAQELLVDVARSAPGAEERREKYRVTIEEIVAAHGYPLEATEAVDLSKRRDELLIGPAEASDIEQSVIEVHRRTVEQARSSTRGRGSEGPDLPAPHVFISYSRDDQPYVDALVAHLADAHVTCWIDRTGIEYGTSWGAEIEKNLQSCAAVVVVMSEASQKSDWVANEILYAQQHDKHVLPLLLNGAVWFQFLSKQYESVLDGGLPTQRWVEWVSSLVREHRDHPPGG